VASNAASLREYGCRRRNGALAFIPYRANSSTRRGGTASSPADPTPNPMISATRSSAATNALPD